MMDHLLDELAAAFPAHPMRADLFHPLDGWWAEYERLESFLADIEGRSWDQLDPEFLDLHRYAWGSMPATGFVALLPAYLRACLADDNLGESLTSIVLFDLTRTPRWLETFDERIALLSAEQRLVIARILAALLEHELHRLFLDDLENALDSYWRSLLEPDFVATPRPMLEGGRFPLSEAYMQERDQLLAELVRVFPAVPMRADMFGDPDGWWGKYSQAEAFMAEVSGRAWQDLDPDFAERHDDALIHMDPAGFIAVLPVYLTSFAMAGERSFGIDSYWRSVLDAPSPASSGDPASNEPG